jgi:membrane protease YdiL (CAAX protease family)
MQARLDKRAVAALLAAAVVGVAANELSVPDVFVAWVPSTSRGVARELWLRAWQSGALLSCYVVAPMVLARCVGVRPAALGLRLGDSRRWLRAYGVILSLALPAAFALSFTTAFRHGYPVFKPAVLGGRVLAVWLPLLAVNLFAVELFYRGFLLTLLTPALGRYALFVMVVPYALGHRDPVEALGAIGVGLLFGWLALASRSIWVGWLAHLSVAVAVELLAIWQAHRMLRP